MLLMVTNRRPSGSDYGDEEQSSFRYHYLHGHLNEQPGKDGFSSGGGAKKDRLEFEATLLTELIRLRDEEGVSTPKVGLYLHGYNNDWQQSIDELFDLHEALTPIIGYEPLLIGFSWPSSGSVQSYLSDREEVRDTVPAFVRFLIDTHDFLLRNERNCFSTSFCIAHSMGNYLLRKGAEYLSDHLGQPIGRAMFNETILLAPDIASKDIENDGKGSYIADFSRRVHVYYSKYDRALKASSTKRFGANRLGRHGADDYTNLPPNVVLVDAEQFANSDSIKDEKLKDRRKKKISVHSSHRYHPEILKDVVQVLSSIDRSVIETRYEVPMTPEQPDLPPHHFALGEKPK